MRHRIAGRKLNRTSSHRKAMRRNMAASLFEHGAIRTTETKAKDVRPFVERLITIARKGTLHARREVISILGDRNMADVNGDLLDKTVIAKLFDDIAPRYANRPGGYTRIIKIAERRIGDSGMQVILQLIDESEAGTAESGSGSSRRKIRASKRYEAAAGVEDKPAAVAVAEPEAPVEAEESTDSDEQKTE